MAGQGKTGFGISSFEVAERSAKFKLGLAREVLNSKAWCFSVSSTRGKEKRAGFLARGAYFFERLGANKVPLHFFEPHQQGYSALSLGV